MTTVPTDEPPEISLSLMRPLVLVVEEGTVLSPVGVVIVCFGFDGGAASRRVSVRVELGGDQVKVRSGGDQVVTEVEAVIAFVDPSVRGQSAVASVARWSGNRCSFAATMSGTSRNPCQASSCVFI